MPQPAVIDWRTGLKLLAATLAVRVRVGMLGRGVRLGPWIPLAQAEAARLSPEGDVIGPVQPGPPLTSADLQEIARLYDPRIHRAAIVSYEGPGNPHLMAEGYPADGWIERVVATPTHLWGRTVEIIDEDGESRVVKRIRAGYTRRSVYIQEDRQDVVGPYLRHVLLASGHAEGQGGNPPMTWFWPQALKLEAPSAERLTLADSGGLARIAYEDDADPAAAAATEEKGMTPEEMLDKLQEGMGALLNGLKTELTQQMDEAKTAAAATAEAQTARIAALEETLKTNAKAEAERTYRQRLTALAGEGRITVAEVDEELKDMLDGMSSERIEARFTRLATRTPIKATPILNLSDKLVLGKAAKPSRERLSEAGLELQEEIPAEVVGFDRLRAMDELERNRKGVAA